MSITMPKVSVVIPLFNKKEHIARAINSVLAQTMGDFEIIIIDDGSTDNVVDVLKQFKDFRVRFFRQPNMGVSVARNRGIERAGSDLIAFLDADDAWKPKFLETVLKLHEKYPQAGICCTAYEFVESDGKILFAKYLGIPNGDWEGILPNYFYSILGQPPVWTSAVLVPKKVFFDVGFFQAGEKLGEDIELWFRIALKYPIAFSSFVCATYFCNAANRACRSGAICPDRAIKKTALMALSKRLVVGNSANYLKEFIYKKDLEVATLMLWSGKKDEVRKILTACRTKRFWLKKKWLYLCLYIPPRIVTLLYQFKDSSIKQQIHNSHLKQNL